MELENLYVCVYEIVELIPTLNTTTIIKDMEDKLYIDGIDAFIESLNASIDIKCGLGAISKNEYIYLSNLINSLDIKQLRTETNFLKMCNECIESA